MAGSNDNALDVLLAEYRKQEYAAVDELTDGNCEDYADYRHRCGIIHGLRLAIRELTDLKKRIEEA